MAFLGKVGSILRQTASKQTAAQISASRPSIFQAIRCMSSSKVFIGGISYSTDEYSLREAFSKYGEVLEARVIVDRETGRSRGFGFVTYTSSEEASSAIQALDGQDLHGRRIRVNYATDRPPRSFGGGFGGGYGAPGGNFGNSGGYGAPAGNYGGNPPYGSSGGGDNFGSPGNFGGNFGAGGGYAGGNTYGSGANANYGVAGGAGGSDRYAESGTDGEFGGNGGFGDDKFGSSDQFGGSNQFGSAEGNNIGDTPEASDQDESMSGDWQDGDNDNVAKRA